MKIQAPRVELASAASLGPSLPSVPGKRFLAGGSSPSSRNVAAIKCYLKYHPPKERPGRCASGGLSYRSAGSLSSFCPGEDLVAGLG